METFADSREFVDDPHFQEQRRKHSSEIDLSTIDPPLVTLISDISNIDCCYTLQSCYGHFVHVNQTDIYNTERLPANRITGEIQYRIAYVAFCIENSRKGREFLAELKTVTDIDPDYVQCGSAEWFWMRQVNSYQLQVEPYRYRMRDTAVVQYDEALYLERVREEFFSRIGNMVEQRLEEYK